MTKNKNLKDEQVEVGDIVKIVVNVAKWTEHPDDPTCKVRTRINDNDIYEVVHIPDCDKSNCVIKSLSNNKCLFVSVSELVLNKPVKLGEIIIARGKGTKGLEEWFLGMVKRVEKRCVLLELIDKTKKEIVTKDFDFFSCT